MTSVAEKIAAAKIAWHAAEDAELANSELARMGDWVRSGEAPTLAWFRSLGFSADNPEGQILRRLRKPFVRRWGFSIPCAEAIKALSEFGPLVEVGAGTGYWSAILSHRGQSIVATDAQAEGNIGYGFAAGTHYPVVGMPAWDAVRNYPDRNVLCSWPTAADSWALATVRLMKPRQIFGLIGEPKGGCTGTPGLYRYLETRFRLIRKVEIPQFPGLRDQLFIYESTPRT